MSEFMKRTVPEQFLRAINEYSMLVGQSGVLVGLSGGADSSVLLHLIKRYCDERGIFVAALHVHHGIRGEEADRDALFCEKYAKRLGVPFLLKRADIPTIAKESGKSVEEAARDYRYSVFAETMSKDPRLTCVATAHNADDNAETVLFNLARGTGTLGLCGIPPVRMLGEAKVIRPLIFTEKSDIMDYCTENCIEYIFDSTNNDTAYTRNYVRREIIPLFKRLNPAFLRAVGRMTESAAWDCEYIEHQADMLYREKCRNSGISAKELADLPAALSYRVVSKLYGSLTDKMLEKVHCDAVMKIARDPVEGAQVHLGGGVRAVISGGILSFTKESALDARKFEYILKTGINRFDDEGFAVIILPDGRITEDLQKDYETIKNIYKLSIHTLVNSDKINRVMKVRSRMDGDSYVFGQMTRKLKKLYNDRGLSHKRRAELPVFCDDEGIIWVPGFGTADRVKPTDMAEKIIYCYIGENDNDK